MRPPWAADDFPQALPGEGVLARFIRPSYMQWNALQAPYLFGDEVMHKLNSAALCQLWRQRFLTDSNGAKRDCRWKPCWPCGCQADAVPHLGGPVGVAIRPYSKRCHLERCRRVSSFYGNTTFYDLTCVPRHDAIRCASFLTHASALHVCCTPVAVHIFYSAVYILQ